MKITKPVSSIKTLSQQKSELSLVMGQLSNHQNRPCKDCNRACSCSQSNHCNCDCSVNCSYVQNELSSEATSFPIEEKILPLVYAFNNMNVCQTCWSCEGHNDASGQLNKLPQLWFYSHSMILLRVMGDCISLLRSKKVTQYEWQLVIAYTAKDSEINAFALKPDLNFVSQADLTTLQQDIKKIAAYLPQGLEQTCRRYYQELSLLSASIEIPQTISYKVITR